MTSSEDFWDLQCSCGEVQVRLHGCKSTYLPVSCACGDCRAVNVFCMQQRNEVFPAKGKIPGYPAEGLYVPDDLTVMQGKDKLLAYQLNDGDGTCSTRILASCCWTPILIDHIKYRGWIACDRKALKTTDDILPANFLLFTKYLPTYMGEDEIAQLPPVEWAPDTNSLGTEHVFIQGWIRLTKSLRGIDERRIGSSIKQLIR